VGRVRVRKVNVVRMSFRNLEQGSCNCGCHVRRKTVETITDGTQDIKISRHSIMDAHSVTSKVQIEMVFTVRSHHLMRHDVISKRAPDTQR